MFRPSAFLPVSVGVALALLAACSSSRPGGGTATTPVPSDPVRGAVLSTAPGGFTERTGQGTSATDLELAARLDGTPGARSALVAEGFRRGYQRLWVDGSGETVGVSVYRFATAAGAGADLDRTARTMRAQAQHVRSFAVAGIPSGSAQGVEVNVEGNRTDQVVAVAGPYLMQVICTSRTDKELTDRALSVAQQQYQLLPAS